MKTKTVLIAALGLAVLALPAAVPASQPETVRLLDFTAPVAVAMPRAHFATLLADPHQATDLAIVLPADYTELGWINADPFAN